MTIIEAIKSGKRMRLSDFKSTGYVLFVHGTDEFAFIAYSIGEHDISNSSGETISHDNGVRGYPLTIKDILSDKWEIEP